MLYFKDIYNQLEEISNCSDNTIKSAIAKTILRFAQERDDFIINDIASCSFTSVSSVTKFCKNLGFAGWKEFYAYLKSEIQEKKEKKLYNKVTKKLILQPPILIN